MTMAGGKDFSLAIEEREIKAKITLFSFLLSNAN